MAYASACDVAALTLNLLDSSASFDTLTKPTLAQVNSWLSTGCALIESVIGGRGFGAIPTTSQAYQLAQEINALYAAALAERSRSSPRLAPGERTRADLFKKDYADMLGELRTMDLSRLGMAQTGQTYAGAMTVSDKKSVESNADRTQPRFARNQTKNPLRLEPNVNTSAS